MGESPAVQSKGKPRGRLLAEGSWPRAVDDALPAAAVSAVPLYAHLPGLAALSRVQLGTYPAAVERVELPGVGELWLKRDDLNAPVAAGNKVRALEFLLGHVRPGDLVLTAGGDGSTHIYATAVHAARLGARTVAVRWRHDMHPQALSVAAAAAMHCDSVRSYRWPMAAFVRVGMWRAGVTAGLTARQAGGGEGASGVRHYVPVGGSTPLGVLGHINAGLELAAQVAAGGVPEPTHLVVPFGSGGTAAGLAIGLGIAGMQTVVVAARVAPRIVASAARADWLVRRTLHLIRRQGADSARRLRPAPIVVEHGVYGGAYGRPLAAGAQAATLFRALEGSRTTIAMPLMLDATYSAKAAAAALALATRRRGTARVLLWLTFDGRVVDSTHSAHTAHTAHTVHDACNPERT
jgi:1-aminocyclopropane-1-carboxylate deaminase/D-cysteine desulfhydrase-like pyridoxal-dependent ACC family enzyme